MQGQRQVSAGAAGLRCGGGGGPETLAVRSGGRGRGPGLRARVRRGRARREIGRVPAVGVRAGKFSDFRAKEHFPGETGHLGNQDPDP